MASGRHWKQGGTPAFVTDEALRTKAKLEAELAAKVPKPKEGMEWMPPSDKGKRRETVLRL